MTGCRFSRRSATRGEEDPPWRVRAGVDAEAWLRLGEGRIVKETAFPLPAPMSATTWEPALRPKGQFPAGRAACPVRGFPASGFRPMGGRGIRRIRIDAGSGLCFRERKPASAVVTLPSATKGGVRRPVKRRFRKNPEYITSPIFGAVPPEPSMGRCRSPWTARPRSLLEEDGGSGGTVPETSCDALPKEKQKACQHRIVNKNKQKE